MRMYFVARFQAGRTEGCAMPTATLPGPHPVLRNPPGIVRGGRLRFLREGLADKTSSEGGARNAVAESFSFHANFSCGISFHMSMRDSFNARSMAIPAFVTLKIRFLRPPRALVAPPMEDLT